MDKVSWSVISFWYFGVSLTTNPVGPTHPIDSPKEAARMVWMERCSGAFAPHHQLLNSGAFRIHVVCYPRLIDFRGINVCYTPRLSTLRDEQCLCVQRCGAKSCLRIVHRFGQNWAFRAKRMDGRGEWAPGKRCIFIYPYQMWKTKFDQFFSLISDRKSKMPVERSCWCFHVDVHWTCAAIFTVQHFATLGLNSRHLRISRPLECFLILQRIPFSKE